MPYDPSSFVLFTIYSHLSQTIKMATLDYEEEDLGMETDEENETTEPPHILSFYVSAPEQSEEMRWGRLDLNDKCDEVMDLLGKRKYRWDDSSGDPNVPVLENYKKESLTTRDHRDPKGSTVLHILARDYQKKYGAIGKDILKPVITYLLDHRDKDMTSAKAEPELQEEPILSVAMEYENDQFIDCVMACCGDRFSDLLDIQDKEGKNFIHRIFALPERSSSYPSKTNNGKELGERRKKAVNRAVKFVPMAKAETLAAKDEEGNTPIHYAMDYRQCFGRKARYVALLKEMILKSDKIMQEKGTFNKENESPLLYGTRTRKEYLARQQQRKSQISQPKAAHEAQGKTPYGKEMQSQTAEAGFQASRRTAPNLASKLNINPEDILRRLPNQSAIVKPNFDGEIRDASESLGLHRSLTALRNNPASDNKINTAPPTTHESNGNADGEDSVNEIREFLRLHYIRTRSDSDARDLIYGKDISDKNLYFDASGHNGADQITELINRMSVGGFSDTLAYVSIPTVQHSLESDSVAKPVKKNYEMNQAIARQKVLKENPNMGRISLISVFNELHKQNVRNILRLYVEDRKFPSHTDAAIEKALQGRDSLSPADGKSRGPISVETWDWRKPDLSIDVITFATPHVEHINLYWSGNQTVLRGWGCSEGIPRLYFTNQKLKTVTIHAAPGLESRDRMISMLERLKNDIKKEAEKVEVKIIYLISGLLPKTDLSEVKSGATGSKTEGEQHKWVKQMEDFRSALISIHKFPEMEVKNPERVKVALIDDGVDLSRVDSYNDIVRVAGRSYCSPDSNGEDPWHRSSGGHGTIMANMILRINPWVSLYVMKLQGMPSSDGGPTIFAESAAKAILGAIHRKVDIISMSWTVKQKIASLTASGASFQGQTPVGGDEKVSFESSGILMLRNAIMAATRAGILMFCSASDDIQNESTDCLPYSSAPRYIFRIGAALSQGQRDPHSEDKKNIDYFFPGNQVAEAWNPRSAETVKYHDGSSVSTALAAGLASLIIHCAIVMRTHHEKKLSSLKSQNREFVETFKDSRFSNFVRQLKDREKMKRAFDNIESEGWEDRKFLPVWRVFEPITDAINATDKLEEKLQRLEKLVSDLCSKF